MADHGSSHNSEHKIIKIPAVPEVQFESTQNFAVSANEIDREMEPGDMVEIVIKAEFKEVKGDQMLFEKRGKARSQGETGRLVEQTAEEEIPIANDRNQFLPKTPNIKP